MDRTLECDHSLESRWVVPYCGAVCFSISPNLQFWKIYQFRTWHCQEWKCNSHCAFQPDSVSDCRCWSSWAGHCWHCSKCIGGKGWFSHSKICKILILQFAILCTVAVQQFHNPLNSGMSANYSELIVSLQVSKRSSEDIIILVQLNVYIWNDSFSTTVWYLQAKDWRVAKKTEWNSHSCNHLMSALLLVVPMIL